MGVLYSSGKRPHLKNKLKGEKNKMEIDEKHDKLRAILIKYECEEFGDAIIDEICELFYFPKTK